jgi:hypothetical protein
VLGERSVLCAATGHQTNGEVGVSPKTGIIGDGALTIFGQGRGTRLDHRDRRRGMDRGRGQRDGYVKGTIRANRVELNSAAVVKGDIFHRTLVIEGSDASMKSARAIVCWNVQVAANVAKLAELVRSIRPVAPEFEGLFCRRREWRIKVLNEKDAFLFVISVCGKCNDARRFPLKR